MCRNSYKYQKKNFSYTEVPSFERIRLGGNKKVNEFKDGFLILFAMLKFFLITK